MLIRCRPEPTRENASTRPRSPRIRLRWPPVHALQHWAHLSDRSHLNGYSKWQTRTHPRDLGRLVEVRHIEEEIASDHFLRFRVRAIHNRLASRSRDDATVQSKRPPVLHFPRRGELVIPIIPALREPLAFRSGEMRVRIRAAISKQKEVRAARRSGVDCHGAAFHVAPPQPRQNRSGCAVPLFLRPIRGPDPAHLSLGRWDMRSPEFPEPSV
jgi:hypothetical protein